MAAAERTPTEGHDDLVDRVRTFVVGEVEPAEDVLDRFDDRAAARMRRLRERAADAGLWALPLPCEWGGGGIGLARYARVAQAEGRSDHGPAALGSAALLDVRTLSAHAAPEVRERYLPRLVRGTVRACFAMTEPGARGSDPATLAATARRDGGDLVVEGAKWFVTGAREADLALVVVRTGPPGPAGRDGLTVVLVPLDDPRVRVVRELPVWGTGGQYELRFDRVRVPADHVLGGVGDGLRVAASRIALGRTLRSLRWLGQAQRAFDLLLERARDTTRGTPALGEHQLVQGLVFESHLALAGARSLVEEAVRAVEEPAADPARTAVATAKVAAARALSTVADAAAQVHGAEGLGPDTPLPRLQRLARQARILDGPDETHVSAVARRLLRS
ncbi:acyl-CoA dehydrogenase family protein [Nocardiopsis sp. CC223A]|uniref:acyl-CoA dehydrogenase family protein n=1 Tax=Nocardiopsis sp. CC223A TaxID=3044051 RepID=UPI00278BB147|nr:acyl-CoA dehydrogenase family protein [Nocardiopsis sp. CC223A]